MQLLETRHIFYSGKTVMIRALHPDDASLIYSWMHEKFYSYYKPYFKHICTSASYIAQRIQTLASLDKPFEIEALVLYQPSEVPIGLVSLSNIDTINLKAEISIAFQHGFRTRCIAETFWLLFHHVFFTLKFNKIYFYVSSDNPRILKIVQNYNIIQEGKLEREILSETGEWLDLYRFCIIHEDWINSGLYKRLHNIYEHLK